MQIPIIVSQGSSKGEDIPAVTATVLFFQLISGALSVSAAEAIFNNKLYAGVASLAPNIDIDLVTAAGASNLQDVFSGSDLVNVVMAYLQALEATWLAGIALAATSLIVAVLAPIKKTGQSVAESLPSGGVSSGSDRTGNSDGRAILKRWIGKRRTKTTINEETRIGGESGNK